MVRVQSPRVFRRRSTVLTAAGCVLLLALAACSSNNSGSATSAASSSSTKSISVMMGDNSSPDMDYLPLEMALKTMSSTYDVKKTTVFSSDAITLQALEDNKIQFMTESVPPAATALAKLPNLVAVGTRANDQWDFVTKSSVTSCTQLNGKKLGLYSAKGVSTAYVTLYLAQACPNTKMTTIITPDSSLRRQAMQAGQIDATPLQATDAVQILGGGQTKFHELVSFGQALPNIGRDLLLTNKQTLEQHPEVVQAFITAQLTAIRSLYANPSTIGSLMTQYLPGAVAPNLTEAVGQYFISHKLFCANGGLNDANVTDSLATFGKGGFNPTTVTRADLVNDTPMNAVLAKLGPSSATTC